jgi:hypothetical protein
MPSGIRDCQADPLAIRETFESSLSLCDLLRGCAAEGRPSQARRKQGCEEWRFARLDSVKDEPHEYQTAVT